ncbi:hypothetical protein Tco_1458304 [Tanacetum coccineum]
MDGTPSQSVARKFLNEVKDIIVTLQHVVKSKISLNTNNWSSPVHLEIQKIFKDEIASIVNQVDVRVIHFEMEFLKEETKFVRDFKSLAKEANESLDKIKVFEKEKERLLRAVVSQDIMSIVQNLSVINTSNFQTELERTKEKLETCIIKKDTENAFIWNKVYKKCEEYKYDKILYDKVYNDMQQQIERFQAQLGDLKGKSMNTHSASNTLDSLSQKLDDENVSLEFQVLSLEKENERLKSIYQNLFDSMKQTRAQTKFKTNTLQEKFNAEIFKNAKLKSQFQTKFSKQKDEMEGTSVNNKFAKPSTSRTKLYSITPFPKTQFIPKVVEKNDLTKPVTSHSIPKRQESKVMKNNKVIAQQCFESILLRILGGKIIESSDTESESNTSECDNASSSNPHEPISKRFSNSTSFLGRVYNRRIKKVMETINVKFDELSVMDFEQCISKPEGMTSRHISSRLDLTYGPLTITSQKPTKLDLELLFEAMYNDYMGG